ncbi:DUF1302 domain-containing protein [Alcanivorax sp. S6407]|uniref:DUF1302 domain-containing protein n=1 Tax=Alcanivorax sp. S6407 TaxID=2926424 RepID=UPI001FF28589|nr:DUF1302 family protein [Alcanivorax sp. S6407]MCK0154360.1 DUF1302 domain-containing protein [Alcanivorax sp. S6407]
MKIKPTNASLAPLYGLPLVITSALLSQPVSAVEIGYNPDWMIRWDNTLRHIVGVRTQGVDDDIAYDPRFDESEYKFGDSGDIVTNRSSLLSEFDLSYKGHFGARVSGSVWKDFAYDDKVEASPELAALGFGTSYDNDRYSHYTERFYVEGAELLDAFAFANIPLGDRTLSLKVGQQTQYWGISLFQGFHSISYSQSPLNLGKSLATPGSDLSELFLPREQVYMQIPLTQDLTLAAQYFYGWDSNRFPEGGTYLGFIDFMFNGPDQFELAPGFAVRRGRNFEPENNNNNHGVSLRWTPDFLAGTVGAYYRRMDETQPWAPIITLNPLALPALVPVSYHQAYNEGVDLAGLSIDKQIGDLSVGAEVSYRHNTALNSAGFAIPGTDGSEGAMGDSFHMVINALAGLEPTFLYDTGSAALEVAWGRLMDVTENEELYRGEGYGGCPEGDDKWDGCSTRDVINVSGKFEPQWLQAAPGLDLSMPISATWGAYGTGATLSGGFQGSVVYSAGVSATLYRNYSFTLSYAGYEYRQKEADATPGYTSKGNGYYFLNDRDWVSLAFEASF